MIKVDVQQIKQRFGIIGNNAGLNRAIDVALQVAPTDLSVLITGESGVGKETFPQIIHQNLSLIHIFTGIVSVIVRQQPTLCASSISIKEVTMKSST